MPGKVNQFTCILLLTKAAKTQPKKISYDTVKYPVSK